MEKEGLDQKIFFAELNLDALFGAAKTDVPYQPVSPFPATFRDLTLTLPKKMPVEKIFAAAKKISSPILASFYLHDLYEDRAIGTENKNATFRFVYQGKNKTLSLEEVEKEHAKCKLLIENSLVNQ